MISIIGAGITGLCLGELLRQRNIPYRIYEASAKPGGMIYSEWDHKYLLEYGPNSLRMTSVMKEFLEETGLLSEAIYSNTEAKNQYVLKKGKYHQLPKNPAYLIFSPLLSLKSKLRIVKEGKKPFRVEEGETVKEFFDRTLGHEITDYFVYPFVAGIFAGDPAKLIMEEAFPKIKEWSTQYPSLFAALKANSTKDIKVFSFENGLNQLCKTLSIRQENHIEYNSKITSIQSKGTNFTLSSEGGKTINTEACILAVPAYQAAVILKEAEPAFSKVIGKIYHAPVTVVHTTYLKDVLDYKFTGFGALNNIKEKAETLGTIFNSSIFPGKCPRNQVLLTTYVGGSLFPEKAALSEEEIKEMVQKDFKTFFGIHTRPVFQKVIKHKKGIPQYDQNVLPVKNFIEELEQKGLFMGGNWIGGISVINCIERAKLLEKKIIKLY